MPDAGIPSGPPLWGIFAWGGDLLVIVLVLAGIARGARRGVFLGVLEGVAVAAGLLLGLTFAPVLARSCVAIDVPGEIALGLVFLAIFLAPLIGLEFFLRRQQEGFAIRHDPAVDAVAGGLVGAMTVGLAAGGLLIGWSMLPLARGLGIDPAGMYLDAGRGVLIGFARTAEPNASARRVLLTGEPWDGSHGTPDRAGPGEGVAVATTASEVFVDHDEDGERDDDEVFIDADGNGSFSRAVPYIDLDGDGDRTIGWLERYRLGRWERVVSVPADGAVGADVTLRGEEPAGSDAVKQGATRP